MAKLESDNLSTRLEKTHEVTMKIALICILQTVEACMPIFLPPGDTSLTMTASIVNVGHIASKEIQSVIDYMLGIAKGNQVDLGNGVMVGLSAPQIGIMKRIIVVDCGVDTDRENLGNLVAYINPDMERRLQRDTLGNANGRFTLSQMHKI
jgi:peptide deformylase